MTDGKKPDRICRLNPKILKACFFGEGLDLFFSYSSTGISCAILVKDIKFLSQNFSKRKKQFLDSFQSVSNYCFGQLKVFARQCPFSSMREWSVLSFEDLIFIIGQEVVPVRMLFFKNSFSAEIPTQYLFSYFLLFLHCRHFSQKPIFSFARAEFLERPCNSFTRKFVFPGWLET